MAQYNRISWVSAATRGAALGKEYSDAWQELSDHIQDHMEALIAAGFSKEAAEEQAVTAMGDPQEVNRLLRKIHRPVLTRMIQIGKTLLLCSFLLWLGYVWVTQPFEEWALDNCYETPITASIGDLTQEALLDAVPTERYPVSYRRSKPVFRQAQVGDCLFTVTRYSVNYVNWYIGGTRDPWMVALQLEIAPEHFWQRPWVQGNFTMVNDRGVEASPQMNYGTELIDAHQYRDGKTCVHALIADFPTDSKWVDVIYTDAENTFTLRIDLEGGTVYEEATPS